MTTLRFIEKDKNPDYYEVSGCSECGATENLLQHKFSKLVTCTCCVNLMVEIITKLDSIDNENYFPDESEALTLTQRNS